MLSLKFLIKPLKFVTKTENWTNDNCIRTGRRWASYVIKHEMIIEKKIIEIVLLLLFFSIRVFFHGHWRLTLQLGKGGTIFYSTLPLPPAHKHSDFNLQLSMWDEYHIFLIAPLVFTRLLLHEIYHLIELLFYINNQKFKQSPRTFIC